MRGEAWLPGFCKHWGFWACLILLMGCAPAAPAVVVPPVLPSRTPLPATQPAPLLEPTATTAAQPTTPAQPQQTLWIAPGLPRDIVERLNAPAELIRVETRAQAALALDFDHQNHPGSTAWVYVLAAPFPTVDDGISSARLAALWAGKPYLQDRDRRLLLSVETRRVLEAWGGWGQSGSAVQVLEEDALLNAAWNTPGAWAILPFDHLSPRWKAMQIDGVSPFSVEQTYPLELRIGYSGAVALETPPLPTNRDPARLTTLALTGVTALSRHIGAAMEEEGVTYPAERIQQWFHQTDLTHISNEVSFYADCPKPGPLRADMRFCSSPRYIELLEAVGADVIELTGNHNLDWGHEPYIATLELYQQKGWHVYGGGANLADALRPLKIEHNGNLLAFLGCSPAGPEAVWATADEPGAAPCDFEQMEQQIAALRAEGYLPIVTLQAVETDTYTPGVAQGMPIYRQLARAGAVIVSGSQAHVPQTMTFVGENFVHYGLGNLFFDQMEPERARQNFIDRHIFYDGRYLGVELYTTLLENSAQPRPMTAGERRRFLEEIFSLSNWSQE